MFHTQCYEGADCNFGKGYLYESPYIPKSTNACLLLEAVLLLLACQLPRLQQLGQELPSSLPCELEDPGLSCRHMCIVVWLSAISVNDKDYMSLNSWSMAERHTVCGP